MANHENVRDVVEAMSDRELMESILLELIAIREVTVEEHMVEYHGEETDGKLNWKERLRGKGAR